jgi:hypothetical protein
MKHESLTRALRRRSRAGTRAGSIDGINWVFICGAAPSLAASLGQYSQRRTYVAMGRKNYV